MHNFILILVRIYKSYNQFKYQTLGGNTGILWCTHTIEYYDSKARMFSTQGL